MGRARHRANQVLRGDLGDPGKKFAPRSQWGGLVRRMGAERESGCD
ncbi:MAG: hypothetical protein R3E03_03490 [Novosphingobium sp.]